MSSSRVSSPADLRQMIQDIKEVALGHTEGQILSALRECGMDPDQAAAMLLDGAEMMDSDDDSDAHATEQGSGSFELETPTSVVLDEGTVVVKNDIEGPLGAAIVKESTEVLHTKEGVTTIAQLCMNYMTDQSTETLPDVPAGERQHHRLGHPCPHEKTLLGDHRRCYSNHPCAREMTEGGILLCASVVVILAGREENEGVMGS